MFIENLQPILVKLGDLINDELVQTKKPIPLLVELEDFQHVGFELVNNHLTHGNIKITYVLVHHYHNFHVQNNNVVVSDDANDMFGKTLIHVYLLGVFNPKGYFHS
jgi:hypothetical protein